MVIEFNYMNEKDIEKFKTELEKEKELLEKEMDTVGERNPETPGDWQARPDRGDFSSSDSSESADSSESYGGNSAILDQLETRYKNITKALERIKSGEYGICRISGEKIEKERLEANPAADTCIKHREE